MITYKSLVNVLKLSLDFFVTFSRCKYSQWYFGGGIYIVENVDCGCVDKVQDLIGWRGDD